MTKYYEGLLCATNTKKPLICDSCGKKSLSMKTTDNKKTICLDCYWEDEERINIPYPTK